MNFQVKTNREGLQLLKLFAIIIRLVLMIVIALASGAELCNDRYMSVTKFQNCAFLQVLFKKKHQLSMSNLNTVHVHNT